jgi:MFS family permease
VLVTARAIQGAAAAMLAPAALGTLITTYSGDSDRGKAFGVFAAVTMGGGGVGLVLLSSRTHAPGLSPAAATHGYTVVFSVAALVFAAGGILAVAFFPSKGRLKAHRESAAQPSPAAAE